MVEGLIIAGAIVLAIVAIAFAWEFGRRTVYSLVIRFDNSVARFAVIVIFSRNSRRLPAISVIVKSAI